MPVAERRDPYLNFRFRVEIDGITQAGFSEVIMPDASADVIEYREGNYTAQAVKKLPGRIKYGNIILKWGITNSQELYNWWKQTQNGAVSRRNGSVVLQDREGNDVARWNFREAWPIRYKTSDLDAKGDEVFLEMIELTHEGMEREG